MQMLHPAGCQQGLMTTFSRAARLLTRRVSFTASRWPLAQVPIGVPFAGPALNCGRWGRPRPWGAALSSGGEVSTGTSFCQSFSEPFPLMAAQDETPHWTPRYVGAPDRSCKASPVEHVGKRYSAFCGMCIRTRAR